MNATARAQLQTHVSRAHGQIQDAQRVAYTPGTLAPRSVRWTLTSIETRLLRLALKLGRDLS